MITYTQQDYLNTLTKAGLVIDSNLYGHDSDAIQGLTYNSKEAAAGTLFVCKGAAFHPQYLADAVFSGATLYVSEQKYELDTKVPYILVSDIRKAMPYLGKLFFNDPSKELNLIGVGGTKGKSTTAYYVKAIVDDYLASIGKKESAVISSIDVYDGVTKVESHITTPENIELLQHFRNAVDSDIDFLEMEVSSQALKYNRVDQITFDAEKLMHVDTIVHNEMRDIDGDVNDLSDGLNSIYILSLLETYAEYGSTVPYIILIEDPEIYLHPQLQKIASEILYKLSRKNQVIFCTHSPQMLFNFTTRQIRQVINDKDNNTVATSEADIDDILDDLGYAANDLMNVSFVFIVEGKQDRSRLPLLLEKYYSEVIDENGNLNRIAIIATNSCTNIKTYANLKYINTLYLKDEFLMIRDGDGKDADRLRDQLTNYYKQRAKQDYGNLPRVTDRNVLILKYYSFENYFLDPEIMTKIGVVKSVDQFYDILYAKYKEYLYRLVSTKKMLEKLNITIETRQDIIDNMENIRKYVRGHNLYDIFYGRYKGEKENAILKAYIDAAPRENFDDIFTAIDNFVYFNNRRND